MKYAKPVEGSKLSDYVAIDKAGHYAYKYDKSIIITRNSIENLRAVDTGWKSRTERDNERRTSQYRYWLTGSLDSTEKPQYDRKEFEQKLLAAKRDDFSKDANGSFAKFLVWLGIRDESATYPVGQTPSKKPR